jgi:hypothetical protein
LLDTIRSISPPLKTELTYDLQVGEGGACAPKREPMWEEIKGKSFLVGEAGAKSLISSVCARTYYCTSRGTCPVCGRTLGPRWKIMYCGTCLG